MARVVWDQQAWRFRRGACSSSSCWKYASILDRRRVSASLSKLGICDLQRPPQRYCLYLAIYRDLWSTYLLAEALNELQANESRNHRKVPWCASVFLHCSGCRSSRVFTHHSVDCPPTTSSPLVYLRHVKVHCDLPVRSRCASFASLCTNTLLCDTEFFKYALDFSPTLLRANRGQDTLVLAVCISRQSDLTSRFSCH